MITPLRLARQRANKKLSEVANALGISESSLSRIECGKQAATAEVAESLSRYFGTISEIEILYPERYVKAGVKQKAKSVVA